MRFEDREQRCRMVRSRHLRRANHSRFAYQSSPSGVGAGSVTSFGPMTASSFFVRRSITASRRCRSASSWADRDARTELLSLLGSVDHLGQQEDVTLHKRLGIIRIWRESERFAGELRPAIDALAKAVLDRGALSFFVASHVAAAAMANQPTPVLPEWLR